MGPRSSIYVDELARHTCAEERGPMMISQYKGEEWQDGKSLSECNLHMLVNEIGCDVTFLVGKREEVVMAHTFILESRAAKLQKLFVGQKKLVSKLAILEDIEVEPFKLMLRYFYSGDIELTTGQAMSLIPVLDKYGPESLKSKCFAQILAEVTSANACDVLETCHVHNEKYYFERCLHFIHINAEEVLASRGFAHISRDCLATVVKADELNADEVCVFNAMLSWGDEQCLKRKLQATDKNRRHMVGNLIFHVRFGAMAIKEFTEKISTREVLTSDEKIKIFQYHHGHMKKLPAQYTVKPRKVYTDLSDKISTDRKTNGNKSTTNGNSPTPLVPRFPKIEDIQQKADSIKNLLKVNRFQIVKGAWKNNGPDAISFKCSLVISLRGIQVYSTYKKTKGFNVDVTIYDQHAYGIHSKKYPVKCQEESRLGDIIFTDPIRVPANTTFTIQTYSRGTPVHCGSEGVTPVYVADVRFDFITSCRSLNGTDVVMGQIPVLLFTKVRIQD